MLAFLIGVLFAFLFVFLLSIMSILRLVFKIDQINILPLRYLWTLCTLVISIILIIIGMWFILDILKIHFNINTDSLNFLYILFGFLLGYIPFSSLFNKIIQTINNSLLHNKEWRTYLTILSVGLCGGEGGGSSGWLLSTSSAINNGSSSKNIPWPFSLA